MQITLTLSDAQAKALAFVAVAPADWVKNFVEDRCRIAIDEIVNLEVQRKLAIGESITGTKEEIVMAADIEFAADRQARFEAEFLARQAAAEAAQQGA